jgi:S-adenosyl-L-methionine hydrolase (adenosine-forming)
VGAEWPDDLAEVIYIDDFGNVISGIGAASISSETALEVAGTLVTHADTFSEVPRGAIFWYANSMGLIEIAVNQGSAAQTLGLSIGTPIGLGEWSAANI